MLIESSTFQESESEWKDQPIEDSGGDGARAAYPRGLPRGRAPSSSFYVTALTLAMLGAVVFVYRRILCGGFLVLVNQMRAGNRLKD